MLHILHCTTITDFDVESQPPLVTATPIPINYDASSSSLPTPAAAISNVKINNASNKNNTSFQEPPLGRHPTSIPICINCSHTNVMTRTSTYPSMVTWVLCGGLVLLFWPACWIPLVMDSAKTTDHICTKCNNVVGVVNPLSDCCVKERG